jgi:hypothetical protein
MVNEGDGRQFRESVGKSSSLGSSSTESSGVSIAAVWTQWAVLLVALPSTIQGACYLRTLLLLLVAPNEVSFPESASVYGFISAFRTHRFYQPPLEFPWIAQIYGPLYVMAGAFFAKLFHGEPTPLTVFMRGVSLASLLGSMAIVGYLCWKIEGRKTWAIAAVMFGLGCFWFVPIAAGARPDLPSILFCLAAVAAFQAAEKRPWLFCLAGALGAASYLTKQNTLAVLLALLFDLLWERNFKGASVFVGSALAVTVPIFAFLLLRHEPFLANFLLNAHSVESWPSVPSTAIGLLRLNQIAVVAMPIALLGAPVALRQKKYRAALLAVALAWLSNIAALASVAGGENYFILPWFLTMLLVPAGLRQLVQRPGRLWPVPAALLALAIVILIHQRSLLNTKVPGKMNLGMVANLTMLGDDPYMELRSRQPQLMDPFFYNELSRQKVWSDADLLSKIDAGEYDLVWLPGTDAGSQFFVLNSRGTSEWGADVLGQVSLHYRPLCETSDHHLALVPKERVDSLSIDDITAIFLQPCWASSRLPRVAPGSV